MQIQMDRKLAPVHTPILEQAGIGYVDYRLKKEIQTILDDELALWRKHAGRLGSVWTYYKGRTRHGIGTEWREAKIIHIETLPVLGEGWVTSKNSEALLKIYHRRGDITAKTRFVEALCRNLSRDTKYAAIGYLILLVMFRLGELPKAIELAAENLAGDSAYGFSDFLRLLDGLLRFEYTLFTEALIDFIGEFIEKIEIHTFRIQERTSTLKLLYQQC